MKYQIHLQLFLKAKELYANIDMRIAIKKAISIPEMLSRETLKIKRIYPEFKVNEEQKLPVENDNTKSEAKKVVKMKNLLLLIIQSFMMITQIIPLK